MTGLLKKKVDKEKIFQKKLYPKRYFIIDYTRAVIQIKHKLDDKKEENTKQIPFRDVKMCCKPQYKAEMQIREVCCSKYNNPFYLWVNDRMYELFTQQAEEREMFLSGFQYVIISTREVQKIMLENDRKLKQQI